MTTEKELLADAFAETLTEIRAWVLAHQDEAHRAAFRRWQVAPVTHSADPDALPFELESLGLNSYFVLNGAAAIGKMQAGDLQLLKEIGEQIPSEMITASLLWATQDAPRMRDWLSMLLWPDNLSEKFWGENLQMSNVLDLDALYGNDNEPIRIAWQGKNYVLLRQGELGARAFTQMQALQKRAAVLDRIDASALTEKDAETVEQVTLEIFKIICPSLDAAAMPFAVRVRTLTHYFEQTRGAPNAPENKRKKTARKKQK